MIFSISSAVKKNLKEAIEFANKHNLNLEVCNFMKPQDLEENFKYNLNQASELMKNLKGDVSLHGCFYDLNPISKDPRIKEITMYRYNQTMEVAESINAKTIIFHAGYNAGFGPGKEQFVQAHSEFWQEFLNKYNNQNIIITLENTYEKNPDAILNIIENVNSNRLKFCIDVGHVNMASGLSVYEWIDKVDKHLYHMHLHNNFGRSDDHDSFLNGSLDFKKIINYLKSKKLSPNLNIEIFSEEKALESINFIQVSN